MDVKQTHHFLAGLAANNTKEWMDAHKADYQTAREDFILLVKELIAGLQTIDPGIGNEDPKKCIFRLNRDVRFSTNKDPYKTHFGAYMAIGGRTTGQPGYYLHIQPGNNFCGGGLYHPEAEALKKVRQEIDYNAAEFVSIVESKEFTNHYPTAYDDRLKTAPKGYPKDHPHIDWLKYKSYAFTHTFTDAQAQSPDFVQQVLHSFRVLHPLVVFLRRGLD